MPSWLYPAALAACSLLVLGLERLRPARPGQRWLRPTLPSDLAHLVFNGHFLGVLLYGIFAHRVMPALGPALESVGLYEASHAGVAGAWPLALQIPLVLFGLDLAQWCVHVALHRVPGLWVLHQTHHSVVDGEMDWIVSFRFQWAEVVVYKAAQYFPLAFLGFAPEAIMVHAIFGTLIGHLNHANLDWGYGRLGYVLNNPRMHLWHHDAEATRTVNFGIIFSLWDHLFGTARTPPHPPRRIGYPGVEEHPRDFLGQAAWPLSRVFGQKPAGRLAAAGAGAVVLALGVYLARPAPAPEIGERGERPMSARRGAG